jgi:hypothetical protein
MSGWIAIDLDGTLAQYDHWRGPSHIGEPVPKMIERVKRWIAEGREVRIFTARAFPLAAQSPKFRIDPNDILPMQHSARGQECTEAIQAIRQWCAKHIGRALPITCVKDYSLDEIFDDRAIQVVKNTGELVADSTRSTS